MGERQFSTDQALAMVLCAWQYWSGSAGVGHKRDVALVRVGDLLIEAGLVELEQDTEKPLLSEEGCALLERAVLDAKRIVEEP